MGGAPGWVVGGEAVAFAGDRGGCFAGAYVVLTTGSDTRRVLDRAKRILPDYMTPTTLTEIPSIPLTDNGKPDLARLPAPTVGTLDHRPDPVASDPLPTAEPDGLAAAVLDIWSRCLRTRVTREDNFFEMGGNSLLVVQVLTSMRERRLPRVSTRDFYNNSNAGRFITLVEQRLEASRHDPDAIPHANPPEIPADAVYAPGKGHDTLMARSAHLPVPNRADPARIETSE
ncbi:phosphopantetheine-binding protein [Embleya sp. NPDC020630]|uniref:phosphopantetheine-binding protein n=1 Tax=Embleya sp. NPDC020630 TaxID=3363979 RepID=UPI0037974FE2